VAVGQEAQAGRLESEVHSSPVLDMGRDSRLGWGSPPSSLGSAGKHQSTPHSIDLEVTKPKASINSMLPDSSHFAP